MANTIATSPGVQLAPHPELAGPSNYMSVYDYSHQFEPDTFTELYPRYGNGKITSFCKFMGKEKPFMADVVMWAEQGRLHQFVKDATVTGDVFDTGAINHNLRVGDIIWLSDGVAQFQADVYEITSDTAFKAHNRSATGAFYAVATTVNLFVGSNSFKKKTGNFTESRVETPEIKENYPQIIKAFYDVAKSDMARLDWVTTPAGENRWFKYEWERERQNFENLIELTNVFSRRAVAGSNAANAGVAEGMNGIVPQLEDGGNVGNGNIADLTDIDDWTKRLRKQGKTSVFTVWADQEQMIDYNNTLGSINAYFDTGANYGMFGNKETALYLDFHSFERNGYSFHLTHFDALNDPTLMGGEKFLDTGVSSLIVPGAEKLTTENDETAATPYLCIRKRKSGDIDRSLEVKVMGTPQNPITKDAMEVHYTTEMTNQVVGANEWGVIFRS